MRLCSGSLATVLVLTAAASSGGQDQRQSKPADLSGLSTVPLAVVSTIPVPSMPSRGLALPVPCGRNNTIFVRFAAFPPTGGGISDPIAISADGQVSGHFGREKITDVQGAKPLSIFLRDNDLYMLTLSQVPEGHQITLTTPSGKAMQQPAVKSHYYMAHFKDDGTYVGVVSLDLPFKPMQLGVFENGDILLAGQDRESGNPRIGIADSRGVFRKSIDIPDDVHARTDPNDSDDKTALPRYSNPKKGIQSLMDVLGTSQIVVNGPELVLFRPVDSSVFSITVGGEVKTIKLKIPEAQEIFAVKPNQASWIVELVHHEAEKGDLIDMYSVDPNTGDIINQYLFPNDLGFGLACADGDEFTFVTTTPKGNGLSLVKVAPRSGTN